MERKEAIVDQKKIEIRLENVSHSAIGWIGSIKSLAIHTLLFIVSFSLYFLGIDLDKILLVLTTIVSLEAIYLAIFIQMSVNFQSKKLHSVQEDVEDIQENVEDIQENVDELQKNVEEIQEDVEEIQKDVEEINEEEEDEEEDEDILERIEETMNLLMKEVTDLKRQQNRRNQIDRIDKRKS